MSRTPPAAEDVPRSLAGWLRWFGPVILIGMAAASGQLVPALRERLRRVPPLEVQVIGHNWWWEVVYLEHDIRTANELHLPAETEVKIQLTAADAPHTLSIPDLGIEADAIPGGLTQVTAEIGEPVELGGECTAICGTAHDLMRIKVVVDTQADFEKWIANQRSPAAVPSTTQQWAGYELVVGACSSCHSLDPAEARSDLLGPNLAHLMSRSVFGGASFALTRSNLRRWLRDPEAMKSGSHMLADIPPEDLDAVVEFLLILD